ncbi:MAG: Monocarboxylate 2-oxoacid-binding periplasmic protein [Alphaproteobacteria bacterium MarineAlpha9_Bin7]|nr:MAG: Monocarboxylate 2-oxoacid-binding periplasmic protein [Alphaproteobacteria bacterium MarineAlpha9_Bin7]
MGIKRRSFLKGGAVGALAATSTFPAPAISKGRKRWKMITCWPKNFPGLGTTANEIGANITRMSEGRLEVKVYGAGEIVPAFELFDAVRGGIAEMGHGWDGYWIAKHPGAPFFGGVPNGLAAYEQVAWIHWGGGQKLWDDMWADFGVRAFVSGVNPPSYFGWYQKEVNSLDDLKGMKIRMAGLPGEVLNRMGVTSVNMPGGEIMSSLQSGIVDAVEWGNAWSDLAFGFYKVADICYFPGIHECGPNQSLTINNEAYDSLPDDLKEIVKVAAWNGTMQLYSETVYHNAAAYQTLKQEKGVQFKPLPEDVISEFLKVSLDVLFDTASKDPHALRIYNSYMDFRKRAINVAPTDQLGYLEARSSQL